MALYLRVRNDNEQKLKERIHKSLIGDPSYINNGIAIVDTVSDSEFILCIGENNDNNVLFGIDAKDIEELPDLLIDTNLGR